MAGRLLDRDGKPAAGEGVYIYLLPKDHPKKDEIKIAAVRTDNQGRFLYDSLPAGAEYVIGASGKVFDKFIISKALSIEPGKTTDLGDIKAGS